MASVVTDADFLSSFLKIGRLDLVRKFFQVQRLFVPTAVYREIAVTSLLPTLTAIDWIQVRQVDTQHLQRLAMERDFAQLGEGEREAMVLARELDSILLMSDRRATRYARALSINVVDIPAFLLAYRRSGDGSVEEIRGLIDSLQEQDHYSFPPGIIGELLQ